MTLLRFLTAVESAADAELIRWQFGVESLSSSAVGRVGQPQ